MIQNLSDIQLNAILAGLRLLQQAIEHAGSQGLEADDPGIYEVATNGTGEMISDAGIDELCERLNTQPPKSQSTPGLTPGQDFVEAMATQNPCDPDSPEVDTWMRAAVRGLKGHAPPNENYPPVYHEGWNWGKAWAEKGSPKADYYIIYEIDAWGTLNTAVIKAILQNEATAIAVYRQLEARYNATPDSDGWQFKMGYLAHDHEMADDGNILRQIEDVTPTKET